MTNTPQAVLLGAARLHVDGQDYTLDRKGAGLLAYLALQGPSPRGLVATLLWPDVVEADARRNLRQRLFRMRAPAGFDLVSGKQILTLDPRLRVDVADHGAQLDATPAELLAGFDYSDCPEFADWLASARSRTRERQLEALRSAASAHEANEELAQAIVLAQRIVDVDPLSEHTHRRLMRLHYLRGDRAAAIAAFERCERLLKDELGARPDTETRALMATIEASGAGSRAAVRAALPAAVLRPPTLVGREAELAATYGAWDAGQVVLLTGEAGAGKSRLIEAAVAGANALVVRGRAGDRATPYALLARLLRAVVGRVAEMLPADVRIELARLLPELGQAVPMRDRGDQARFMDAIESTLERAAIAGLALVAVDDLHAADDASVEALAALAGGDGRLRWLLAARAGELGADRSTMVKGLPCTTVALRPLTEQDIGVLIDTLQIAQFDAARLAAPLARHAGGNPMFVLETVKQMLAGRGPSIEEVGPSWLPVPERVQQIIEQRIERLSAPAVRLMRCAALAEQDFDASLAAEVLGCRPLDLADAWSELEAQQVLNGNAFAHDLVSAAALMSVPMPVRKAIHGDIARCLKQRSGDAARIAGHFAAAGASAAAVPHWLAAGSAAQSSLRFQEAARFFEQAARAALAQGERGVAFDAAKQMRAAAFEIDLTDLSEAALGLLEQSADSPAERAFALSERAVILLHRGDIDGTERCARAGLQALGAADAPLVRIELRRNLAAVHTYRNETFAALAELRSVQHEVDVLAPPELKFQFLQSLGIICDHADQWEESQLAYENSIQLGLQVGNVPGAAQSCLNFVVGLLERGHAQRALLALERARGLIATMPAGHPSYSSLDLNYGIVLRMLGDYSSALEHIQRAVQMGTAQTPGWLPLLRGNEALTWLHLGQTARAHQALQAAVPGETTPIVAQARWHCTFSDVERALGREAPSLEAVIGKLPAAGRRGTRWRLQIKAIAHDGDWQRVWHGGQSVLEEVRRYGRFGMLIDLGARLSVAAAHIGQDGAGAQIAREVLDALDKHEPNEITRGHALSLCAQALAAAADPDADAVRATGVRWLHETARAKVPPDFRESFQLRHEPHRLLLEASPLRRSGS